MKLTKNFGVLRRLPKKIRRSIFAAIMVSGCISALLIVGMIVRTKLNWYIIVAIACVDMSLWISFIRNTFKQDRGP